MSSKQHEVLLAVIRFLRQQPGTAIVCNLTEQLHAAFLDCQECQERWDGTTFKADGKVYEP